MGKDKLVFLYPQEEIFNNEITSAAIIFGVYGPGVPKSFRQRYSEMLNLCLTERYRKKGFSIYYAILDDSEVSTIVSMESSDEIIKVGMDSKTHRTKREDKKFPYPNQDYILNQLSPLDRLVVTGFHMWDCVEKLAERAHKRGIDVLVDEDLTEQFPIRIKHGILPHKYPSIKPNKVHRRVEDFMKARRGKPWLWQDY